MQQHINESIHITYMYNTGLSDKLLRHIVIHLRDLDFSHDTVLIERSQTIIQNLTAAVEREAGEVGLRMSAESKVREFEVWFIDSNSNSVFQYLLFDS